VFHEPLAHNPLIEWYRRRTPGERSHDEHPLRMADIERARTRFGAVHTEFFDLLALTAPFLPARLRARALPGLRRADAALFRAVPFARRYAWVVVLRLERPVIDLARAERSAPSVALAHDGRPPDDRIARRSAPEDLGDELVERAPVGVTRDVADEHGHPSR
jgi:hypothetical protein